MPSTLQSFHHVPEGCPLFEKHISTNEHRNETYATKAHSRIVTLLWFPLSLKQHNVSVEENGFDHPLHSSGKHYDRLIFTLINPRYCSPLWTQYLHSHPGFIFAEVKSSSLVSYILSSGAGKTKHPQLHQPNPVNE